MAKRETQVMRDAKAARAAAREAEVAALRDGRRRRAQVLNPNRRAQQSRMACRKGAWS